MPTLVHSAPQALVIPEGSGSSFTVAASLAPSTPWRVTVTSGTPSVSVTPASIDFDAQNWQTPVTVRVQAAIDSNQLSEQTTIKLSAPGIAPTLVPVTVQDTTQLVSYGFPSPALPGTITIPPSYVIAFQVTLPARPLTLHALGALPKSAGDLRMALYRDTNGQPGALLAGANTQTVKGGETAFDLPDTDLGPGVYWIALRVAAPLPFNASVAQDAATACARTAAVTDIHLPWPTTFGAATCSASAAINVWLSAYQN